MPFATCNQAEIYYEVHGAGEPLLLVMGQGSDHHGWDLVRDDFAARHTVVVFDHRGTGQSDKPEQPPYSTSGFAADAIARCSITSESNAHIVTESRWVGGSASGSPSTTRTVSEG